MQAYSTTSDAAAGRWRRIAAARVDQAAVSTLMTSRLPSAAQAAAK